jgi:hypothetical protein
MIVIEREGTVWIFYTYTGFWCCFGRKGLSIKESLVWCLSEIVYVIIIHKFWMICFFYRVFVGCDEVGCVVAKGVWI